MLFLQRALISPTVLGLLAATAVVTVAQPGMAQDQAAMIRTAEATCLQAAGAQGYDVQRPDVIAGESAVDGDTVKVVLNLTRDGGQNFARLTCPYSVSQGNAAFDDLKDAAGSAVTGVQDAAGAVTTGATANAPDFGPLWWLLLPLIGLPLLFAWSRGRDRDTAVTRQRGAIGADRTTTTYSDAYVNTVGNNTLNVHEHPNSTSNVLRMLTDKTHVYLSGRHDGHWAELRDGGWIDARSLRLADGRTLNYI